MTNPINPPVTASATAHAARIREGEQQRAEAARTDTGGQQTYERYAERALAGHRVDEAARERARLNELQARGVITAEEPEPDVDEEEFEEEVTEAEEDVPLTTAEVYAAQVLGRISAEGRAAAVAWKGTATGGALIV